MQFSIICIYNKTKLKQELEKSLDCQENIEYEKIFIDNTQQKYKNAKDALIEATQKTNGKYLLFLHQDIIFENKNTLKILYDNLEKQEDFGIAGVAGQREKKVFSNITHGKNRTRVSNEILEDVVEVDTVDECLFVIKKNNLMQYNFDSLICNTWHLYSVEYSLMMKVAGKKIIVIPIQIYHASKGNSFNNSYFQQMKKITKKYKTSNKRINTTLGRWFTNPLMLEIQIIKKKIKGFKDIKE